MKSAHSATKPWWQQATALVSVSTGGVITGLSFAHGAPAAMTAPEGMPPVHLMALEKAASPAGADEHAGTSDTAMRSAIVNVAKYYLNLSRTRTPAQMEALIWGKDSTDGADHGDSCAAFASLTLELGSQAVGQQSWVSGGSTYPWPVHDWVDARVDPNPDSPAITSVLTDAEAHGRWHALGDGYQPQPGDWVLFHGHVEVVTGYSDGVLDTIGGDSLPNFSVNAHTYSGSLADQGIAGFVNNGSLSPAAPSAASGSASTGGAPTTPQRTTPQRAAAPKESRQPAQAHSGQAHSGQQAGSASIPGATLQSAGGGSPSPAAQPAQAPAQPAQPHPAQTQPAQTQPAHTQPAHTQHSQPAQQQASPSATIPGLTAASAASPQAGGSSGAHAAPATIPGLGPAAPSAPSAKAASGSSSGSSSQKYSKHAPAASAPAAPASATHQAFINAVAPGAMAAQQRWGVPASVTIAQAIEESDWGTSQLAAVNHNLFGIKGSGPAGSAYYPTSEFEGGQWITVNAAFRAYHNMAESISDHAELLATSGYYSRAMADRNVPDAFASDLTGVYATDPNYGSNLIATMKLYNLYQYDTATSSATQSHPAAAPSHAAPANQAASSAPAAAAPVPGGTTAAGPGGADIPGLSAPAGQAKTAAAYQPTAARRPAAAARYTTPLPTAVTTAYFTSAKTPIGRSEQLYKDVASQSGISWKLLAACDWMQCQSDPRRSPVHGEKLGSVNRDGSVYGTKSEALTQCAADMITLARAVYGIDLTVPRPMSVRALAEVFAAYRWGGLLKKHGVSAMEFPYSVAGLTDNHTKMQWPSIREPNAPDKPGSKFKPAFGAVPVVLSLKYPATV